MGLDGGGFILVWQQQSGGDAASDIFGQRFDDSAHPIGGTFQLHNSAMGEQANPHVAALPDGAFVAVWDGQGAGDEHGVFARVFGEPPEPVLVGTDKDNELIGDHRDTVLFGMDGDDLLDGGGGDNILWGGPGADIFRFSTLGGTDTVADFGPVEGDVLRIDLVLNGLDLTDDQSLESFFALSFADGDTTLKIDASGSGNFDAPDKTIVVAGVDLVGGAGTADALNALVQDGQLEVVTAVG